MKSLSELSSCELVANSRIVGFSRVKDLKNKKMDYKVYLPSKEMDLQRDKVWSLMQKRELIMSILIDRPIPNPSIMSVVDRSVPGCTDDVYQVIDGKQRLTAMADFYDNEFDLELEGGTYYFKDLPEDYQFKISRHRVIASTVEEDYDKPFSDQDKIDWFNLVNFAGTDQEKEHMDRLKS